MGKTHHVKKQDDSWKTKEIQGGGFNPFEKY